jgi:hypothetical protein
MAGRFNPLLLRLSRWPRRIAAVVCLLLAAASTLTPADGSATRSDHQDNPVASALHAGQVAVPLPVGSARAAAFVRTGDHVGVFRTPDDSGSGTPELIADGLRVLAASASADTLATDEPVIVVAADPAQAARLAAVAGRSVLVVLDKNP